MDLTVHRAHILDTAPGWRHDFAFPDWDLWMLLDGCCLHRGNGEDRRLEAGDSLLLAPGSRHRIDPGPGSRPRLAAVHFSCDRPDPPGSSVRRFGDPTFSLALLHRIVREPAAGAPYLAALLAERERAQPGRADRWQRSLDALCIAIRERPHEDYGLGRVARHLRCSPGHLSRRFRHHAGSPLSDYVIAARLDRARLLLRESGLPLREVASSCGYASLPFFCRQFRQHQGCTPAAYRGRCAELALGGSAGEDPSGT